MGKVQGRLAAIGLERVWPRPGVRSVTRDIEHSVKTPFIGTFVG
jgi:hypothetical protein